MRHAHPPFRYRSAYNISATVLTVLLIAFPSANAETQEADEDDSRRLSAIVITAERRETTLLETPLSVSALSSDQLQADRIETLSDIAGKVPGITLPNSYANMQAVYIRGIGTNDPGVPAAVGIYIDDVYVPRTFGNALFDLPDVARIEILRGPQGTLYGQNTSAGAVKIVSKEPGDTFEGYFFAEYGSFNTFRTQTYVTAPIVEGLLSASFAYSHRQRDGYTWNANTGRWVDALNTDQFRAKLKLTPSEGFKAILSVDGSFDNSDNAIGVPLNYGTPDPRVTWANTDTRLNRDSGGATLHLTGEISPQLTIKSITGYRTVKDDPSPWDFDGTPADGFGWSQELESKQYSQEIQLLGDFDRLTWTIGAVGLNEEFYFDRFSWRGGTYSEIESNLKTESWGIYGQANYNLTDKLRITGGLRYGAEQQKFSNLSFVNNASSDRTSLIYEVAGLEDKQNGVTPKVAADYRFSPFALGYVSYTRGQKSGGFNRAAGTAEIASIPVGQEEVTAYEAGLKGGTSSGFIQGSVAAFYNDFKDYQASIANPTVNGVLINGQVVVNAGAAHTYGVEAEATLRPSEALTWSVSAAWLKSEFDSFANPTGAAASDFTGNQLPYAPEWTIGTDLDWILPLSVPGEFSLGLGIDYRDKTFTDAANLVATRLNAQTYVDLGLTYRTPDRQWTFQALARNLFDETEITGTRFRIPSVGADVAGYSHPRIVTISARYGF